MERTEFSSLMRLLTNSDMCHAFSQMYSPNSHPTLSQCSLCNWKCAGKWETLHTVGRTLVCWTVNVWVCVLMHADTVCVVWINVSTPFIGLHTFWLMCFTTQYNRTLQVSFKLILHPKWSYFGETMVGACRGSEGPITSGGDVQVAPVDIWIILELILTNVIQADHSFCSLYLSNLQRVSVWYWKDRIWVEYHFKTERFDSSTFHGCCYFSVQLSKPYIKEWLQFISTWVLFL